MDPLHELKPRLETLCRGPVSIEPIEGGITNLNFLVETGAGLLVARVCEELPLLGIDRRNEAACQRAAARLSLAPELIHQEPGLLVSRHVPGRPLTADDLSNNDFIIRTGDVLRRLHGSWDQVSGHILSFCPFQTIRTYAQVASDLGARLPEPIGDLVDDSRRLSHRIGPFRPVLCHNDLLPANLIWDDARLWLIDWEYAGMGNPLFDLASVSAGAGFTDEQDIVLLKSYRGAIAPRELDEIRVFKTASLLREALWAVIQTVSSTLSFDYHDYAARNLEAYRHARAQLPG
jgi:thiamine kinase-like enzyme